MSTAPKWTRESPKVLLGLLLGILAYQGKQICSRMDALEKNQVRIMVHLGLPPVASEPGHTLKIGVKTASGAAPAGIKEIKEFKHPEKKGMENPLDTPMSPKVE